MTRAKSVRRAQAPKGIQTVADVMELLKPDPKAAVRDVIKPREVASFIKKFGLEAAKPHFTEGLLLESYCESRFLGDKTSMQLIFELLKSQGAQQVASSVNQKPYAEIFVKMFGVDKASMLPKEMANHAKGRHLEDELGL